MFITLYLRGALNAQSLPVFAKVQFEWQRIETICFCLCPSAYTEYSVKNSLRTEGKDDLIREFTDACWEYGLEVGLYLSPWNCNHSEYGTVYMRSASTNAMIS